MGLIEFSGLFPASLAIFNYSRMACRCDGFLYRRVEKLRLQVQPALTLRFRLLDGDSVRVRISVLANPGNLPGNFLRLL